MRAVHPILSALLLFAPAPVAEASPGAASDWQPPTLISNTPAPEAPAPTATAIPTTPGASAPAAEPTPRLRPPHKRCKKGKARCQSRRPKIDPRLAEATMQRTRVLELARPLAATGRPGDAARMLVGAASAHADPILYLAAAQAELSGAQVSAEHYTRALHLTKEAQRLIVEPKELRISAAEGPALSAEVQALTTYVTRRKTQLRHQRRGKAELATGAAFLVLGASGLGMLASGAALASRLEARGPYTGENAEYQAALKNTERRAGNLLTAGILVGVFGSALGIPLTIMGIRDLKRARSRGAERPTFRLLPSLTGVSISGKF